MAPTDPARGKALREFDFSNKKQWTENDLTLFTVTAQENSVEKTPKADSDEYLNYYLQKQNNLDEANGVGNPEDRQLRTNIFELENIKKSIENSKFANTPKEHPLYVVQQKLESDIKLAGVDKITFQMFNFVQAKLLDPIDGQIIRAQVRSEAKKTEGYNPEVSYEYETLNQYIGENVSDLMSGFEYILNN